MTKEDKARNRSRQAVEMLGSAIDIKINELTESNRQLKRKIFDLYTIFEISRNFNSVLNYQTLVDSFLLTSLGQVGAASAALFLPDENAPERFNLVKSKGLMRDVRFEDNGNIVGNPARNLLEINKPIMTNDFLDENSPEGSAEILSRFKRGIILPLIFKSNLKGLLILGGKVSHDNFAPDDIDFLSILANQFVVALENARLYESEKITLKELRQAQKQLVLTERAAAMGDLSAKIAHEVNNPLSIISNYLHLAGRSMDSPETAHEYLGVVKQELDRIAGIVRQLLDFHRPRKARIQKTNLRDIIDATVSLMKWQLEENKIDLNCTHAQGIPLVMADHEQLKQVFLNLIINAKDFMPDGGSLTIDVTCRDNSLIIIISDTGCGIPEENLSRIFEPFYTTKDGSLGTGLGLSVCYGIIKEHGGNIIATNNNRGGSSFEIILPASETGEVDYFGNQK
ncbi:MAG: ATP-binding protein [Candidatus Zixiibacteriota bacterium]